MNPEVSQVGRNEHWASLAPRPIQRHGTGIRGAEGIIPVAGSASLV